MPDSVFVCVCMPLYVSVCTCKASFTLHTLVSACGRYDVIVAEMSDCGLSISSHAVFCPIAGDWLLLFVAIVLPQKRKDESTWSMYW